MTRTFRNGAFGLGLLAFSIGTAIAAPASQWTSVNPLQVTMTPVTGQKSTEFAGQIRFSMTNNSNESVSLLKWQTPFFGVENNLFEVYLGGEPIEYTGRYVKRGEPTADDYMTLAPHQSRSVVVDLTESYELERTGQYQIKFHSFLQEASVGDRSLAKSTAMPVELESFPMVVYIEGSDLFQDKAQPMQIPLGAKVLNPPPAYESCSTSQKSQLVSALNGARNYASDGHGYFSHSAGPRYTTWFGAYTSSRYSTGNSHFANLDSTLHGQTVTFNCGCHDSYYAYVYPNQPYRIYVCNAFWSAPNTGTDSRAGTIIHETSHFTVVAGTQDYVYGQTAAKNLANSNPKKAVGNADNHEYFGENTPYQN